MTTFSTGKLAASGCADGISMVVQGFVILDSDLGCSVVQCEPVDVRSPDITGDMVVDLADLSLFGDGYPPMPYDPCGDIDASGITNLPDFARFGQHWDHTCGGAMSAESPNAEAHADIAAPAMASSHVPFFVALFNDGRETKDCPGFGIIDTLSIWAFNLNTVMTAAEFSVDLPPAITPLGALPHPEDLSIGTATITGVSIAFPVPRDGSAGRVRLHRILIQWLCGDCSSPYDDNFIIVQPHAATGFLGVTDMDFNPISVVGLTSVICPNAVATSPSTWGKIKAMYEY
jgi:hypothetical protein